MQYEDDPEFNNYIDNLYDDITIEEFSRPASIVLFTMDEEAYLSSYNQYISQQKDKLINETVLSSFPGPIAFYFERSLHGADNNNHRLNLLRSTWESLIFFLYAIVLGEIIDLSIDIRSIRIFPDSFNKAIKLNKSGLLSNNVGYRLEVIEKILEFNDKKEIGLMVGNIIPIYVIDKLRDLSKDRNSLMHGQAINEREAEETLEQLLPKVHDILFALKKLEYLSLVRYRSTSDSSISKIKFSRLNGCSLNWKNFEKEVKLDFVKKNFEYLKENFLFCEFEEYNNKMICLSPFACSLLQNQQHYVAWYKQIADSPDKVTDSDEKYEFEIVSDASLEDSLDHKERKKLFIPSNVFSLSLETLKALL